MFATAQRTSALTNSIKTPRRGLCCWTMGCTQSKDTLFDHDRSKFKVINIDGEGNLRKPGGYIEITDTELILYHRGKVYTTWPLIYIKRYGFDVGTFTFQSGRRCGDRAGNFAFHCDRAKELFELLQAKIQGQTLANESLALPRASIDMTVTLPNSTLPNSKSFQQTRDTNTNRTDVTHAVKRTQSLGVNSFQPGDSASATLSPDITNETNNNDKCASLQHLYTNTMLPESNAHAQNYVNVDNAPQVSVERETCRYYINVTPSTKDLLSPNIMPNTLPNDTFDEDERHCYANLDMQTSVVRKFNYVTLDLEHSKEAILGQKMHDKTTVKTFASEVILEEVNFVPAGASKKPTTKGYAIIDYDKTVALSNSVNPSQDIDEGSRKTRHNSTISDLKEMTSAAGD